MCKDGACGHFDTEINEDKMDEKINVTIRRGSLLSGAGALIGVVRRQMAHPLYNPAAVKATIAMAEEIVLSAKGDDDKWMITINDMKKHLDRYDPADQLMAFVERRLGMDKVTLDKFKEEEESTTTT